MCACENGKYLASIIDDSVIMCDEIIDMVQSESKEALSINFNDKNATCKIENFDILHAFLLITISILVIVNI